MGRCEGVKGAANNQRAGGVRHKGRARAVKHRREGKLGLREPVDGV